MSGSIMIERIIRWSVKNRILVLLIAALLASWGWMAVKQTPLDAIPDLSDVQIIIRTNFPGQSPEVVENQVTYPLTTTMLAVPGAQVVRGYSFFGDSYVYVIFKDGTDLYWARSRVLEYINQVADNLPKGVKPRLGPDATGVGWVYSYVLQDKTGQHDLAELRSLQDWFLKFELQTVPGVAEVATVGGMVKQYQIIANPEQLRAFGVSLTELSRAIKENNQEVGGSVIELSEAEYMVHSKGYLQSIQDIESIPVKVTEGGLPLLIRDLASVQIGPEMRRVVADLDGEGEVAGGIIVMRYGENALKTIGAVKKKIAALKQGLPDGVEIIETYDRSTLIKSAVDNLTLKLAEEFVVVAVVCLLFLLHLRSAFVAIVTLPLGILLAFIIMRWQGVNANIMSLGGIAIAIGAMIDAAIVMIENTHKHFEKWQNKNKRKVMASAERWQLVTQAATEVGPALFFSLLIITLSFIPVFTLEAQEGRLFSPLAFTKTYAMAMAAALAITVIPVLMGYFIRGKLPQENSNPLNRFLIRIYQTSLNKVLLKPVQTLAIALLLLGSVIVPAFGIGSLVTFFNQQSGFVEGWNKQFTNSPVMKRLASGLGSEFMPPMNEGDLMYMPTTLPGISIGKAQQLLQQTDRLIKSVPEVKKVFGKMGRADTATDSAPLTMIETIIQLKPKDQWREGMTLEKLIEELDQTVDLPGLTNAWLMPIKTRIDMLATGIKTPVGVKVSGPNLKVIERIGRRLETLLMEIPGTRSAYSERVTGGRYVQVSPDREKAAFLGVSIAEINHVISAAVGGLNVSQIIEGAERYPINIRFAREVRDNLDKLRALPIITKSGAEIALASVAEIKIVDGAPMIKSENARRSGWTFVDIHQVDLGSYIEEAQKIVQKELYLPVGYSISWTGQYEYMLRAEEKLKTVIPLTLIIVMLLLYLTFGRLGEALLVMTTLPFAIIGGFWLLFILNYHLSIATAVGFIALLGVAAEFGVVMLVYLNAAVKERKDAGQLNNRSDLKQAIMQGAVLRIRPKAMTVAVIVAGLLPIMYGDGAGSELMQRIAAPMIGGMITAPLLSLFVIPVVYLIWKGRELK